MSLEKTVETWRMIKDLLDNDDSDNLGLLIASFSASDTARALSRLDRDSRIKLLTLMTPEQISDFIITIPEEQAVDLIDNASPGQAAAILEELPSDEQVDILGDLDEADAEAILQEMAPDDAERARELLQYPEDTAGGIMTTEYLVFSEKMSVKKLLDELEQNRDLYTDYEVQYAFVKSKNGKLTGVLPLRNVLFASRNETLGDLMISDPISVQPDTDLTVLIDLFEEHSFLGVPVLDEGRIVGLVHRAKVMEAAQERESDSFLKVSGIVGGEELRSMPLFYRSRRRLSWLSINIVLNIVAASVIVFYQDTLASIIALAVFLPIISDMSGCSGNQAVAVSIRELTLGITKPFELVRVFLKEFGIGIINGIALGTLLGMAALIWKGNIYLGIVVGGAMLINTIVAVCLGGLIPLILKRFGKDPALASGPLLTTVTDMCGFFLALSFASLMLPLLTT